MWYNLLKKQFKISALKMFNILNSLNFTLKDVYNDKRIKTYIL